MHLYYTSVFSVIGIQAIVIMALLIVLAFGIPVAYWVGVKKGMEQARVEESYTGGTSSTYEA